jgi:hypothetical protein
MPRKPHPADIANAAIVASAIRFDIALFLGTGAYARDSAKTLDEARVKAARLAAEHPNGRRPLIYGVTAEGRSGLVTDALLNPQNRTEKTIVTTKTAKKANTANAKASKAKAKPVQKAKASNGNGALGKRAAMEAAAREGKLPSPPDFSAETHARFRGKLAEVVALAKAADLNALRKFKINPYSTSPKAIARYRDLCVLALEAKT